MSFFDGITDDFGGQDDAGKLPPASNRGVTDYILCSNVCVGIDFLVYSVPPVSVDVFFGLGGHDYEVYSSSEGMPPDLLAEWAFRSAVMPHPGLFLLNEAGKFRGAGYDTSLAMSAGTLRFHSRRLFEQKINVQYSGQDLAAMRQAGIGSDRLVQFVAGLDGSHTSRADLAVDYFRKVDPFDLRDAYNRGEINCKAKSPPLYTLEDQLQDDGTVLPRGSVRFGVGSSRRGLRVYDKAFEQNLPNVDWVRLELQLRDEAADVMVGRLAGADDFPHVIQAAIRDYCDAPTVPWYCEALSSPAVDLPKVPRRESDTEAYLMRLVECFKKTALQQARLGNWRLYDAYQKACDYVLADGKEVRHGQRIRS